MTARGAGGCLIILLFALLELAALGVTIYLAHLLLAPLIMNMVPASEADFARVVAVVIGIIAACIPVFLLDRWCKRLTGTSVLDNIPFIP